MGGRPPMGGGWGMVPAPAATLGSEQPASLLWRLSQTCCTFRLFRGVVLLTPSAQRGTRAKHLRLSWAFPVCPGGGGYGPPPGMYGGGGYGGGGTSWFEIAPVFYKL